MSKLLNYFFNQRGDTFSKASEYKGDGESNYYLAFPSSTTRETGKKNVRPPPGSVTFCFSVVFLPRRKCWNVWVVKLSFSSVALERYGNICNIIGKKISKNFPWVKFLKVNSSQLKGKGWWLTTFEIETLLSAGTVQSN